MARTKRSAKLDTRTARMKLAPGLRHQEPMAPGHYLVYRRSQKGGGGTWAARWAQEGRFLQARIGFADDFMDADGINFFTYAEAQEKARAWFKLRAQEALAIESGEVVHRGSYTVADAIQDYLGDAERRGIKGLLITKQTAKAHILPALGELEVSRLTKRRLETWHAGLASQPRRKGGRGGKVVHLPPPANEDERRARKDSANRILTVLKAALNLALANGRAQEPAPWRKVKPFREVAQSRIRYLNAAEQKALMAACEEPFRSMVMAAIYTGCRYSEITRLRVKDFNQEAGTLFIDRGKTMKARHIYLTDEAVVWFRKLAMGRKPLDVLLSRGEPIRRKAKTDQPVDGWRSYDQKQFMTQACQDAGIEPLGFHELRHTYASHLVNAGVPLAYVAAQLGHADTRMVLRYYGHLAPSAMAEAIRRGAPKLNDVPQS